MRVIEAESAQLRVDPLLSPPAATNAHALPIPASLSPTSITTDGTFLETSFEIQHGRINYRLKNTNPRSKEVWRYHSFDSYATFGQKKSTMIAALKKVDYFASDNSERMISAIHKLREFRNLDYPNTMRREVCEILMQESGNIVWRIVGALQAQI